MKEDGGQAFPFQYGDGINTEIKWEGGMSLRDFFAAKAMQGFYNGKNFTAGINHTWISEAAYKAADAMLSERSKV